MTNEITSLLNSEEAAAMLGIAAGTLANQRQRGEGPRFVRIGAVVRYRREDLADYVSQDFGRNGGDDYQNLKIVADLSWIIKEEY